MRPRRKAYFGPCEEVRASARPALTAAPEARPAPLFGRMLTGIGRGGAEAVVKRGGEEAATT